MSRYVRTPILSDAILEYLEGKGVKFATVDDCTSTMLRIASEPSINGKGLTMNMIVPHAKVSMYRSSFRGCSKRSECEWSYGSGPR